MRRRWMAGLLALAGAGAVACSDDTGPSMSDLFGTWIATKAEVVKVSDPNTKVELVAQGLSFTVIFGANSQITITSIFGGDPPDVSSGTFSVNGSQLTVTITSSQPTEIRTFTSSLSGNVLTLTGGAINFDFGSGTEEAGKLNLTLTKQ